MVRMSYVGRFLLDNGAFHVNLGCALNEWVEFHGWYSVTSVTCQPSKWLIVACSYLKVRWFSAVSYLINWHSFSLFIWANPLTSLFLNPFFGQFVFFPFPPPSHPPSCFPFLFIEKLMWHLPQIDFGSEFLEPRWQWDAIKIHLWRSSTYFAWWLPENNRELKWFCCCPPWN